MADFLTSTHRAKWISFPQDLKEKYKAANQRAKQMLEKFGATRVAVDIDGSLSYPEPQNEANAEKHSRAKPLKIEEEQLIQAFYEFKIQDVCDAFKFPQKIQVSSAMVGDGTSSKTYYLALAALRRSNQTHGVLDFKRYLSSILSRQHPTHTISELTVSLNNIDSVSKLVTPTTADMKHVDRKLKYCRDPGSHDKSKKRKHRSKESPSQLHNMA